MNKHDLIQKIKALEGISQDERAYLIDLINTKKKYGLVWEDKPEDVEETLRQHLPVLQEVVEKRIIGKSSEQNKGSEQGLRIRQDGQDSRKIETPTLFDSVPTSEQDLRIKQDGQDFENNSENNQSNNPVGRGNLENPVQYYVPNHTLIEGDNLHALTALTFTHENKIDVIYIDPPYNTGNKDFKYNDSFVDKEDSYRHSKWLSFMDKRLRIAKRLLSDKGVIFISIDDNEQAQLKMLCDEVFGEENFLNNVIWQKKFSPQNDAKYFSDNHDFILVYKKTNWKINHLDRSDKAVERYKNPDNDPRGVWTSSDLTVKTYSANYDYPITTPSGKVINPTSGRCWNTSKERMDELIKDNRIWFGEKGENTPRLKKFLTDVKEGVTPMTIWLYEEVGHNQSAKQEMKVVLHDVPLVFDTPKPVKLIDRILKLGGQKDSTILDFFAGSGTTLHATMALNAEDGGNRQCILVTNNENNICEEVTYERNKRVIEGYTNAKGVWVEGLSGNNLRYYKTATVEREPSLRNKRQLTRLATELLCIKEDCYKLSEQVLRIGQDGHDFEDNQSNNPVGRGNHKNPVRDTNPDETMALFEENGKRLLLVYDDAAIDDAVELLKQLIAQDNSQLTKVYVFSNGQYPYTEDFEEVLPHITLCALPDAIYKAYQHVLPKRVAPVRVELEEENSLEQD